MTFGKGRRLQSWIESFITLTETLPSPTIFRKWVAISGLASAMERRIGVPINSNLLYPNMYVLLVGGPGSGKSISISQLDAIIRGMNEKLPEKDRMWLAPSDVSKASLIDSLVEAKRRSGADPAGILPYMEYNSLYAIASEFTTFFTEYAGDFVTFLTKMWDCEPFEERKRTADRRNIISKPQLSILGGTTPSSLGTSLPPGAWDQGFSSRTLMIYSGASIIVDPFAEVQQITAKPLFFELMNDYASVFMLSGQFSFTPDSMSALRSWHMGGQKPMPDHPKLVHYLPRRTTHLAKLCMVYSISRSNDLIITMSDFESALATLLEVEFLVPEIFKDMSQKGGDTMAVDELHHYLTKLYIKDRKPIAQHRVWRFLQQRTAAHAVPRVVENMIKSGMLAESYTEGKVFYIPLMPNV